MIQEMSSSDSIGALFRNGDPAVVALIDTKPTTVRDTVLFSEVFELLLDQCRSGVVVVNAEGVLRGACTLRTLTSIGLPISGATAALMPSLRFLREDLKQMRERLEEAFAMPVAKFLDPYVPELTVFASLPEVFFQFFRNNMYLPIIDDANSRRLVGVIEGHRAIERILVHGQVDAGRLA